ncbi:hypothetical protein GCM10010441_10820 [Kitasatospora paracochleata]|uniref:Uncharacterized protein n=1 Tax=Kitasatospora paracochleata TaxID=58354 RepID=A0ABT1J237_9ACTN|nr:hypothetical protein [Kitasatospora paracochleata]MCP2311492.1 hypothetical protein [Kitasatospora paracochleata]
MKAARPMKPPAPGSVAHSLAHAAVLAVVTEAGLALVGGLPAFCGGALVLAVLALATARYVAGADSEDRGHRDEARRMHARQVNLGDWRQLVDRSLCGEDGYGPVLRHRIQRLYDARLLERHRISRHHHPERVAELTGPQVWPWLDPARTDPPGPLTESDLRMLVDQLHRL